MNTDKPGEGKRDKVISPDKLLEIKKQEEKKKKKAKEHEVIKK